MPDRESVLISSHDARDDTIEQITKKAVKNLNRRSPDEQKKFIEYAKQKNKALIPKNTLHGEEIVFASAPDPVIGTTDGKLRRASSRNSAEAI